MERVLLVFLSTRACGEITSFLLFLAFESPLDPDVCSLSLYIHLVDRLSQCNFTKKGRGILTVDDSSSSWT